MGFSGCSTSGPPTFLGHLYRHRTDCLTFICIGVEHGAPETRWRLSRNGRWRGVADQRTKGRCAEWPGAASRRRRVYTASPHYSGPDCPDGASPPFRTSETRYQASGSVLFRCRDANADAGRQPNSTLAGTKHLWAATRHGRISLGLKVVA